MTDHPIKSVCVYCGSRMGAEPHFEKTAKTLGTLLGNAGMNLVYGAGSIGLMGVVARAVMASGGAVTGIIPEHLDAVEITQEGLNDIFVTDNMHDRKRMMFDRSDAFVVLPGGLGTLDETFEILTWAQLSLHRKPIIILNSHDFWTPLLELIRHVIDSGFANPENRRLISVAETPADVMMQLQSRSSDESEPKSHLF